MALKPCPHCGHPISEKAEKCPACHQDPRISPEKLAQQTAEKKARRNRTLWIGGICAAVVLIVGGILAALFLPDYLDYRAACDLLDKRDYVAAAAAFDAMDDYRDSAQQALEARYQYVTAHKSRDDQQTRDYLQELVDAEYKNASSIEEDIYRWNITIKPCGRKNSNLEKNVFSHDEIIYFYVEVHGGRPDEFRNLSYRYTFSPDIFWSSLGVSNHTGVSPLGRRCMDGSTYWADLGPYPSGNVSVTVYDSNTHENLCKANVTVY